MLDYDEEVQGMPLEEMVQRTFTVTVDNFGAHDEIELIPNGANTLVTKKNVRRFVKLFIEWTFIKQCQSQLVSFKKGFERTIDLPILKSLVNFDDLEQLICGQRELNFEELRDTAIYANGFTPHSPMMKWFWEIVLDEWDDEKRRKLLSFSTGSDRAPVNGLKSMKFYLVMEGEDDSRLPTSHTCFNQLLIPKYTSKDVLRKNLEFCLEHTTGFGMV